MLLPDDEALIDTARAGFAGLSVSPAVVDAALTHLARWLSEPTFASYRYQIVGLIERALENIINNATRYTPSGGTIAISLSHESGSVMIRISQRRHRL